MSDPISQPAPDGRNPLWEESLVRPLSPAPHDGFFADGEEPPDRYDLEDELEYVLPKDYDFRSARYFRIAWNHYRSSTRAFTSAGFRYFLILFLGSNCIGWIYWFIIQPPLRAGLMITALNQLTGLPNRYGTFFSGFKKSMGRLIVADLPVMIAQFVGFLTIYISSLMFAMTGEFWAWVIAAIMVVIGPIFLALISIRVTGFSAELILDHRFDAIQAIRGTWFMSKSHFFSLFWLKFRLVALEWIVGIVTLGIGLIWVVPFTTLVWTAAYLDIAGSEDLLEFPRTDDPSPDEKQLQDDQTALG